MRVRLGTPFLRVWFNSRMRPCQGRDNGAIPFTRSSLGAYPAYHVKYIERSPLAGVPADWLDGFEVKLVAKRDKVEKAADAAGGGIQKSTGKPEGRAELLNYAKRAVIRLSIYQQQLRLSGRRPGTDATSSESKPEASPEASKDTK